MVMERTADPGKLNAIEKALEIMLKFQGGKPSWGIRELSGELGFSPATVQRILSALKSYGFVRQDTRTRQYCIGGTFYRFLEHLDHGGNLTGISRQFMETVAAETRETVHLNIIQGGLRICVDCLESPRVLKAGMPMGNPSPLYAGASAKCLLAFSSDRFQADYLSATGLEPVTGYTIVDKAALIRELSLIRDRGFAESLGERTQGLGALSAPVFDYRGEVMASLSLAIPEIRFTQTDHKNRCIHSLLDAARAFSQHLGQGVPPFEPTMDQHRSLNC